MEPRVFAHSQTYRLRERMSEAEIRHGQEVRADLPGIRVTAVFDGWRTIPDPTTGVIFFCTMGPITIRKVLQQGDGHMLPSEVVLEGLAVPGPGTYDIMNALVHSNGRSPGPSRFCHSHCSAVSRRQPGLGLIGKR